MACDQYGLFASESACALGLSHRGDVGFGDVGGEVSSAGEVDFLYDECACEYAW